MAREEHRRLRRAASALLDGAVAPQLIVSDVDGTLINSRERVTTRLRIAVERHIDRGGIFALATGRPPRWITPIVEQLPVQPLCVCSNGAVVWDPRDDHFLQVNDIPVAAMREIIATARQALAGYGGMSLGVERAGSSAYDPPDTLFEVEEGFVHAWESTEHGTGDEARLLSSPAMKVILRNHTLDSKEMFDLVAPHIDPALAHVTFSMSEGLLEVTAPGVNKSTGLEYVAEYYGVDPAAAVAFGDMPNDIEMLQWAGLGVAMGNAQEGVKRVADLVTSDNDDFGVARVIERLIPAEG